MTLSQWKSTIIAQGRIQNRHPERYPKVGVKDALLQGVKRLFTITSGPEGTKIYIDGKLAGNSPRFNLFLGNEGNIGQLILGNSPTGKQYWTGNLLGLAIYNRSLTEEEVLKSFESWENNKKSSLPKEEGLVSSYLFNERSGTLAQDHVGGHHLLIPSRFKVLQKTILVPPWKDFSLSRSYFMDILTNILGFIPFGFFFSAYLCLRKPRSTYRILLISILLAGCISLSIELIQVYLPTRSSQLTDVITNILGAVLGVILFYFYQHRSIQSFIKV
jgi:VanZ family protein